MLRRFDCELYVVIIIVAYEAPQCLLVSEVCLMPSFQYVVLISLVIYADIPGLEEATCTYASQAG